MNNKIYILFLILFLTIVRSYAAENDEQITLLQSDRLCYVSGDIIFVKAIHLQSKTSKIISDAVLYVDIVNRDSQYINGEILKMNNGLAEGFVRIPDSVKTGYYSLRVYTAYSMNLSKHKVLQSEQLFITNRFGNNSEQFAGDTLFMKSEGSAFDLKDKNSPLCSVTVSDTAFAKRSKVKVTLQLGDNNLYDTIWAALSVKPVTSCELQMESVVEITENNIFQPESDNINYQNPENKGMIITGHITHSVTGNALSNILVLLAFEDSVTRLRYSITNQTGEFKFLLANFYEKQVVYISTYAYPNIELYSQANISLDSKFLDKKGIAQHGNVVGYERTIDSLNVLKSVIAKAYNISNLETPQSNNRDENSFEHLFLAGDFTDVKLIDEYIELPDFIQITREILPFIRLRKKDNKYAFSIIDGQNNVIRENPIIFVDGVPLNDINSILGWGSDKIKMVQVQCEPRYFGDVGFENGMVFIWTKKMDFWSKGEYKNTHVFSIPCFQKPIKLTFPDYSKGVLNTQPDFRQILFWEPSVVIKNGSLGQFEFYTSDEAGEYEILLHGLTNKKEPVLIQKYIQVK